MRAPLRTEIQRGEDYEIHILGVPSLGLADLYPALLRSRWPVVLGVIVGGYLLLNAGFALLFMWTGGVAHAAPGSFADAFFFSIQTMGTIGYGTMVPETPLANLLVVAESVTGLVVTALATGLVFARFSLTRARVIFSHKAAIAVMDGVPTLMVRLGNARRGDIVDVHFKMTLMRTTRTREGVTMYRSHDLTLVRDHAVALSRSWMVLHAIVPGSPLHGETAESLAASEAELTVSVAGIDGTSLQPVHARSLWSDKSIVFGSRLADVLSEEAGRMVLDLRKFHELTPAE